ncbi:unnamed protein product [Durusdinium trenchii]|uniref:GDP-fucose protein O-fucosyltransferase 1 n=1 Tax=Durusdinium trenchii TaxID=1381693 RepID=A0ABP0LQN6_9DINO
MMPDEELQEPGWVLVQPHWGLCNRLRAVTAGRMLANHLGREFVLDWQPLPDCNCRWRELFATELIEVDDLHEAASHPSLVAGIELLRLWDEVTILAKQRPESEELRRTLRSFNSFHKECFRAGLAYVIDPASDKWRACKPFNNQHLPKFLQVDCVCVRAFNPFYPPREEDRVALAEERADLLNQLQPILELQSRLWQLPEGVVSVHIRRSDHQKAIARSPEELFLRTMESYGEDVMFFLATDDPNVEERMKSYFGPRLLTSSKRTLNRNCAAGIQDALIDLLLLSQGAEVLGSFKSSFSAMASHFRMVPFHVVDISPVDRKAPTAAFREVAVIPDDPEDSCSNALGDSRKNGAMRASH